MGWLKKILKGSSNKGHYNDRYWDEPRQSVDNSSDFDGEEIECAIALSLSEVDYKGKKVMEDKSESEEDSEDEDGCIRTPSEDDACSARAESEDCEQIAIAQPDENEKSSEAQLEDDEELARAIQESLNLDPPPPPPPPPICAGCNAEIGHGRYLSCMGGVWHPQCFRCHTCNQPITDYEFSMSGNRPYHKTCYKEKHHPRCDVCDNYIPSNAAGLIEYRAHPFWMQKYCPSHERDKTPRCCSCERMEPRDTRYILLDDGRKLCLECLDSAIMDTHECQPLYLEIQGFYDGLNMKVEQQVPLLLVERPALNDAMDVEKHGLHHLPETRGLCLSEEQTVTTVLRRPRIGNGNRFIDMITEPYRVTRRCEVTAILILYGLPRLLTGSILAHEMMHAWLRLNGYPNLSPEVEEGICQVLAHMWLDSEIYSSSGSDIASSSSSTPSSSSNTSSKKGQRSDFEKKLGEFFKHQIESDTSSAYGEGFRQGNQAVLKYGLRRTLDNIRMTGNFP
ncbi:hypothetical protein ACFE04_001557 [Oxalis oulophora]